MAKRMEKTEHAGAKNGGGYWGRRAEAKSKSKRTRRTMDRLIVRREEEVSDGG